jgi:hypothetical protein
MCANAEAQSRAAYLDIQGCHIMSSLEKHPSGGAVCLTSQEKLQGRDMLELIACWGERADT